MKTIVELFKETGTHMWFKDPLLVDSIIHYLPVVDKFGNWIG